MTEGIMHILKQLAIGIIIAFAIGGFLTVINNDTEVSELETQVTLYWACMDGCSNMQELVYGTDIYRNETMKFLHIECTVLCCKQYMGDCEMLVDEFEKEVEKV